MSPAIESASVKKKAQPCKISVEVGGGPQQQCAFFLLRRSLKELPLSLLSPPPPPTPTVGSVHYSWSKLKQGKVCGYEVEDMKHNERAPVCEIFTFSRLWSKE